MTDLKRSAQTLVLWLVLLGVLLAVISFSVELLPSAPSAPTPTWPQGISLPNKLPRIAP